jgi:protein-disulfide isomerase
MKNMRTFRLATLAALTVVAAFAQTAAPAKAAKKSAFDKATMEAYVRYLMPWDPRIEVKIADPEPAPMPGFKMVKVTGSYQKVSIDEIFYVSLDGQKIVRGSVYDVAQSPFADELKKLHTDLSPSLGTPGAKVVMVLFTDFECPFCKEEAKVLRDNLVKTYPSEVRLYFKEFPLESIHPWAKNAAIAGRCVYRQNAQAFWDYHDYVFENQSAINDAVKVTGTEPDLTQFRTKIVEWAASKGLDAMQLGSCIDHRSTEAEVDRTVAEARALRVNQTPSLFVNGRPLAGGIPWEQLKTLIDMELERAKTTGDEVEKCCQISLPTPGKH